MTTREQAPRLRGPRQSAPSFIDIHVLPGCATTSQLPCERSCPLPRILAIDLNHISADALKTSCTHTQEVVSDKERRLAHVAVRIGVPPCRVKIDQQTEFVDPQVHALRTMTDHRYEHVHAHAKTRRRLE
jgi:hypothetical protein